MTEAWKAKSFVAPEIIFGLDAIEHAGRYAVNCGMRKALVVTDSGVMNAGWTDRVVKRLEQAGVACELYAQVSPNPRDSEAAAGAEVFLQSGCNALVAVGGGSPTDCAKAIGIVVANGGTIHDYEGVDRVRVPIPPLLCVPTTAGAAADVSQFAIVTDTTRRLKMAIVSKSLVPDVTLTDPQTLLTMPAELTASTGLDALVHAVEAYVSNAHGPLTDVQALAAIRRLRSYLPLAFEEPEVLEYRSQTMLASLEAGLAFSNAILGAVHALAHSLGGLLDLPHGDCNALLLEYVTEVNFSACPERYLDIAAAMGLKMERYDADQANAQQALVREFANFRRRLGVTQTLGELGMRREDIPQLAVNALNDACMATNPRFLDVREVERIYEKAF